MTQPFMLVPHMAVSMTVPRVMMSAFCMTMPKRRRSRRALDADEDLTDDDSDDHEVVDGALPVGVALAVVLPAVGPDGLEERD
jgi:uncharacterized protein (UPF0303 family)